MENMHFVGLDVHKKIIAFCVKQVDGKIISQGTIDANRRALGRWVKTLTFPWEGALEATIFTGWIYDFLKDHALAIKVAHPPMLEAITVAKKKNDISDAEKLADLLRCNLLPECYIQPKEVRELRRVLRYRTLIMRQIIRMKNKISGLLMEEGIEYEGRKLHTKRYFFNLLEQIEISEELSQILKMSRECLEFLKSIEKELVAGLKVHPEIQERLKRLRTIPGVGQITALTWILEIGDVHRFPNIKKAVSYCGLCSGQKESGGKQYRGPISKKRNKHLQTVLIEAAKFAPLWNKQLAEVYEREKKKGHRNRATLAVARKLVAYLLAVDKSGRAFELRDTGK
jgi:transposase